MNFVQDKSWLEQPGIKAMMPVDRHTQSALRKAMEALDAQIAKPALYFETAQVIPLIIIRDGDFEHLFGSDTHDSLYIDKESGGIQYLSLHCSEGTKNTLTFQLIIPIWNLRAGKRIKLKGS